MGDTRLWEERNLRRLCDMLGISSAGDPSEILERLGVWNRDSMALMKLKSQTNHNDKTSLNTPQPRSSGTCNFHSISLGQKHLLPMYLRPHRRLSRHYRQKSILSKVPTNDNSVGDTPQPKKQLRGDLPNFRKQNRTKPTLLFSPYNQVVTFNLQKEERVEKRQRIFEIARNVDPMQNPTEELEDDEFWQHARRNLFENCFRTRDAEEPIFGGFSECLDSTLYDDPTSAMVGGSGGSHFEASSIGTPPGLLSENDFWNDDCCFLPPVTNSNGDVDVSVFSGCPRQPQQDNKLLRLFSPQHTVAGGKGNGGNGGNGNVGNVGNVGNGNVANDENGNVNIGNSVNSGVADKESYMWQDPRWKDGRANSPTTMSSFSQCSMLAPTPPRGVARRDVDVDVSHDDDDDCLDSSALSKCAHEDVWTPDCTPQRLLPRSDLDEQFEPNIV